MEKPFSVGEVVIIKLSRTLPELVGEECTIDGPLLMHSTVDGYVTGHRICVLGEKQYKGMTLVAPPHCLRRKRPPYHDWADAKVASLIKSLNVPTFRKEKDHAAQGH